MRHFLTTAALVAAATTLSAGSCVSTSQALRTTAAASIQAYNDAGIDPLQLPTDKLAIVAATCATVTGLVTVVNPEVPSVSEEVAGYCALVQRAAAPAVGVPAEELPDAG